MGKPTGFIEYPRAELRFEPVADRVVHYSEFVVPLTDAEIGVQGARCMDCGIPFCHQGCPVNNIIPDFNDLVYQQDWQAAIEVLHSTNNFPEFTGRICPAPCEASCTLNIDDNPVAIKAIERAIADKAWEQGWVKPQVPMHRSGKRVAVIGSGPAGLACAQQLARAGHSVSLYEKEDRIGGLLRYGIPDFKLAKTMIDRRMSQMRAEGVEFHTNSHVGVDLPVTRLLDDYDAIVLSGGAERPRDLDVPGRSYNGIHFAMDFLHPVQEGLLAELKAAKGLELDLRGNVKASTEGSGAYQTTIPGVFAAGDMRRGQSLVVWAIREGRQCARAVDEWLMGRTDLPR